ncbi:helix-turn-helix domain-containing protein [candidate division WOR-3 bacterium]|uniref:Helix-turn-helix domain-containing protein n=1 Tax=candidate division WOR-3 bacterium TaxID=2052148 RepID=A0A937XEK9_UNCW3|nr:helix-turn-helix domain-containing protein [candidate division WOR-3 bacterium]
MKRSPDTFIFTSELGSRLRDLRLKAGLTQMELARAMGRAGKSAGNLVSRLEKGDERYPSFGLIADFLRGCRAGFRDINDIFDLYTGLPTAQDKVYDVVLTRAVSGVVPKWQAQVTEYDRQFDQPKANVPARTEPSMPDRLKRLELARKNAAAARRRYLYGEYLKVAVNKTGLDPIMTVTEPLFKHGLEWFGILFRTRSARPGKRETQLAESEARFAKASGFPLEAIRELEDGVRRRFAELEMAGELNWLPNLSLAEYEAGLLAPARKLSLKQEQHRELVNRLHEHDVARKAATEKVWAEVQQLLDEAGVPGDRRVVYRGLVSACCTAALNHEPNSVGEKAQLDEYILSPLWISRGLDQTLAEKLCGVMLPRFRELAKTLPPDPRPKR